MPDAAGKERGCTAGFDAADQHLIKAAVIGAGEGDDAACAR